MKKFLIQKEILANWPYSYSRQTSYSFLSASSQTDGGTQHKDFSCRWYNQISQLWIVFFFEIKTFIFSEMTAFLRILVDRTKSKKDKNKLKEEGRKKVEWD